jgi:single-stranded-DNA-specific exonuclease
MKKRWIKASATDLKAVNSFAAELSVDLLTARLLIQRGLNSFEDARHFFRPSLDDLHDPFLMKDMDKAVERLTQAVHQSQKILVYGDYDVDGTTAVTMMFSFLRKLGVSCEYYIPDRYTEGYGFSYAGVDYARDNGIRLIITLDCGIKDGEKIAYAKTLGIDVIVCDHHNPGEIPKASAVLDPKRQDCNYPFDGLSGCGVGFKLIQAFCQQQSIDEDFFLEYLDLLTISIGADIVPIINENRILAYHGLQLLTAAPRAGIAAMLEGASVKKKELNITDVVFILAPRINAAGRIFSGKQAVELLLSENIEDAKKLSPALEENNQTRKLLDKEITSEALEKLQKDDFYLSSFTSVVAGKNWHKGVVGIVASRLIEASYKPTIVLVDDGEKMSGSARSIDGIDLYDVLGECAEHLIQYGGHTMAAGLSLKSENFLSFRKKFDDVVAEHLNHKLPEPFILYDAEVLFEELTPQFWRRLKQFAPFGPGNMKPVFMVKNVVNAKYTRQVGETKTHLKLHVCQRQNPEIAMEGIGFDLGKWAPTIEGGQEVDLLFTLEENEWNNRITLQLSVKDIRLSADVQAEN